MSRLLRHLLLSLLMLSLAATKRARPREMLQVEKRSVVRVSSEQELQTLFKNLEPGMIVQLEMEELRLTKSLILDVPQIAILGSTRNLTRIKCPPTQSDSALLIREGPVDVESVFFDRCRGYSAVVVENDSRKEGAVLNVRFDNVRFSGNGASHKSICGAAVRSNPCARENCVKPMLHFKSCNFSKNHASYGGAIYAADADLKITDSIFSQNEAEVSGGAIYLYGKQRATLLLQRSSFEDGLARGSSRAGETEAPFEQITNAPLPLTGTGGAIFAINPANTTVLNSHFRRNHGCHQGGAMAVFHVNYPSQKDASIGFDIRNSSFEENFAFCGPQPDALMRFERDFGYGGALAYASSIDKLIDWSIKRSHFYHNRAVHGGALHLRSKLRLVTHGIQSCRFRENAAIGTGGAMNIQSAAVQIGGTDIRQCRAAYGGGIAVSKGGMLTMAHRRNNISARNRIEGCKSFYGGGIYAVSTGNLNLSALILRSNTGFRFGGGAFLNRISASVLLKGITVEDNRAAVGGGIGIFEAREVNITLDTISGHRTIFTNNTASIGGGFFFQPGTEAYFRLRIEDSDFLENEADPADKPRMQELAQQDALHVPVPEAHASMPKHSGQPDMESLLTFLTRIADGRGGGICIAAESLQPFAVAEVVLQHLHISKNKAKVGGGMSIKLPDSNTNDGNNNKTCFPSALGLDSCRMLLLVHVDVTGNMAEYAGGVFAASTDLIMVSCSSTDDQPMKRMDHVLQQQSWQEYLGQLCSSLHGNQILDGEDLPGADIGTRAKRLVVKEGSEKLKVVASGEKVAIPCADAEEDPARCTRDLQIAVKDSFNQTISRGIDDAELELVLISDAISGALRYKAVNGVANISETVARGINKTSALKIVSETDSEVQITLELTTRACHPGESAQGDICSLCSPDQYGFDPQLPCNACEEFANCDGGSALVPVSGYWHSTPFSPAFHQCIHSTDCKFEGRENRLKNFFANATNVQMQLNAFREGKGTMPLFSDYVQCAEGHEGLLCGSCETGYGRSLSNTCAKCPSGQFKSRLLTVLSIGWLFLLIGANCVVMLISMKTRVQLVMQELQTMPPRRMAHSFQTSRLNLARISDSSFVPAENSDASGTFTLSTPTSSEATDFFPVMQDDPYEGDQKEQLLAKQLVAAVQLAETLKILMNYLQVSSTALQLSVDWNVSLKSLLSAEAFAAGLLGEVVSIPYECNFSESSAPPPMSAFWMKIATPWIILSALQLVFVLTWFMLKSKGVQSREHGLMAGFSKQRLLSCLIVISIVVIYFSYSDLAREFLRAVNCMVITSPEDIVGSDHPYIDYAVETANRRIWAEDTQFFCFEGQHLPIAIVGIGGMLLCLFFILGIIFLLPLNKKHLIETEFVARYWFLYQAYRKEWHTVAWESTILIRKSLLDAVVVFAVHTGSAFQASLCAGILVFSLALHSLFAPFKQPPHTHTHVPEYSGEFFNWLCLRSGAQGWKHFHNNIHLNHLESASLTASIAVFYTIVVSDGEGSTSFGRNIMTAFAFALNLLFLVYMLYRLYAGSHVWLDLKIKNDCPTCTKTWAKNVRELNLVMKLLACIQTRLGKPEEHQREQEINGVNVGGRVTVTVGKKSCTSLSFERSSFPPARLSG